VDVKYMHWEEQRHEKNPGRNKKESERHTEVERMNN
jgi:hypothetical protein